MTNVSVAQGRNTVTSFAMWSSRQDQTSKSSDKLDLPKLLFIPRVSGGAKESVGRNKAFKDEGIKFTAFQNVWIFEIPFHINEMVTDFLMNILRFPRFCLDLAQMFGFGANFFNISYLDDEFSTFKNTLENFWPSFYLSSKRM